MLIFTQVREQGRRHSVIRLASCSSSHLRSVERTTTIDVHAINIPGSGKTTSWRYTRWNESASTPVLGFRTTYNFGQCIHLLAYSPRLENDIPDPFVTRIVTNEFGSVSDSALAHCICEILDPRTSF